jgi:hypothetical protein
VDTVRDYDDDEVMMWLVFVSFFYISDGMGWDEMGWVGGNGVCNHLLYYCY